jgi:DNA processing protein
LPLAGWHTGDNAPVTSARDTPDNDEVWGRVAWATVATPGDRVVWQAIDTFGPRQALDEMWAGHSHARVRRLAAALDVSPGDILAFRRRYPKPPTNPWLDTVRLLTRELDLSLLHPGVADWPERLMDLGPYQPIVLFATGQPDFLHSAPTLGVVGSRSPTAGGLLECRALARDAIDYGYALVSGGARGIDWIAHEQAALCRAPQVMVLATATDRLGSWQGAMVQRVSTTGLVITETPPGHSITPASFLHRNRVIAALSDRVVVVEAAERSGSLNTASHAKTLGRDLSAVISRPKDDKNAGCYRLVDEWGADRYRVKTGGAAGRRSEKISDARPVSD